MKEEAGPLTLGCYGLFPSHPSGQKTFLWAEGQRRTFLSPVRWTALSGLYHHPHQPAAANDPFSGRILLPKQRSWRLSLSLSLLSLSRLKVPQVVPFLHTVETDLTVVTACLGAAGGAASPGGSVPGQPLLGVRTVGGTADRRRLLELPALMSSRRSWAAQLPSLHHALKNLSVPPQGGLRRLPRHMVPSGVS